MTPPRHLYIVGRALDAFDIQASVSDIASSPDITRAIDIFLSINGPKRLILSIDILPSKQKEENSVPSGIENQELWKLHATLSDGNETITKQSVYFMKNKRNDTDRYAVDPQKANDGCLSFGVIRTPLESLDAMVQQFYKPVVHDMGKDSWGEATADQRTDFFDGLNSFSRCLRDNIRNMNGGFELKKIDERIESMNVAGALDPVIVSKSVNILQEWCRSIERYLDESDKSRWESPDSGIESEIDYWKNRTQRLTNVTEQLKKKSVKYVLTFLNALTRQPELDIGIDFRRMNNLLSQWHEVDVQITEAANEAKDNVKYLSTLERFIPVLNSNDPIAVGEVIPALINAVKMIHTISRYFNTSERVSKLLMNISNQLICVCKLCINNGEPNDSIWNKPIPALLQNIEKCLSLNDTYHEQYQVVKDKLSEIASSRKFDFPDMQIFGKFDLFCQRLTKLMDMFSTIQQYNNLRKYKFDNLDGILNQFNELISSFKGKGHDLLDYHNNRFDRDYVGFNEKLNELEKDLQAYINTSFDNTADIEKALALLGKYQAVLHRDSLRNDIDNKLSVIFQNYGAELLAIEQLYEKEKNNPPLLRNTPPVAGNISWSRHLLNRIEKPIQKFEKYLKSFSSKESKRIVKTYNKLAKTLLTFEYLWFDAWCSSIDNAKTGLQATLIVRNSETGKLYVNFDTELFQLIREAKCLVKLGLQIPDSARLILQQEEKYKSFYNDMKFLLTEYDRVGRQVVPIIRSILEPHFLLMESKLRPGLVTLTWTSLNIDQYKSVVNTCLVRLQELVSKVNDIIDNRIQKNLWQISKTILVSLPVERAVTVEEFVLMQENAVKNATNFFIIKNIELENAVFDIFDILTSCDSYLNQENDGNFNSKFTVSSDKLCEVHQHFEHLTYQALLTSIKTSLNIIKKRAHIRSLFDLRIMKLHPFFEVDVQLSVSNVRLSPSLVDIQRAINRSTVAILSCAKKIYTWDITGRNASIYTLPNLQPSRVAFFEKIGQDTEIVKTVLLMTGAISGVRKLVNENMTIFDRYSWLWKDDKELTYRKFISKKPSIEDFENELKKFVYLEEEISSLQSHHIVGVLALNTSNLKTQLWNETRHWKVLYSQKVYMFAKEALNGLYEYMRVMTNKLNIPVQSLDNLGFVMNILKEIREKESSINMEVAPILDMYSLLERYLPEGMMEKEEMEKKAGIYVSWRKLIEQTEHVTASLSAVQGKYKSELIKDIREFGIDIRNLRKVFEDSGPYVPDIKPAVAIDRLKKFKEEINVRERKLEMIRAGETLFAFRTTQFNEITKTKKEIAFLDTLYTLYTDVLNSVKTWSLILWSNIGDNITSIQEIIVSYDARAKKLPKKLREWSAYVELTQKINDIQLLIPLIIAMSKPSIKPRHWQEINAILTNVPASPRYSSPKPFQYQDSGFRLSHVINSGIVKFKDEVEEICDGADKQLAIEKKIQDLKEHWTYASFEFVSWKNRDVYVLKAYGAVIEDLEEAQQQLQTLLTIRHVSPFREEVSKLLSQLSDTADTLEMCIKVQMLWTSLESVFLGGDIAKQMPLEAKKFTKINKDWEKLMSRARDTKTVVLCCNNELLRSTLPVLYTELEKCQKSLEGYLEQKRSKFPRFYFVSNPVLLVILSQGSDPMQMQIYYEKVFDSIDHVTHSKVDKSLILEIQSSLGNSKEVISLANPVKVSGNIEDWLGELEGEMQRSLKRLCEIACVECITQPVRMYANKFCGQFALLGLQVWWTNAVTDALTKCKTNKHIMSDTLKVMNSVLSDISAWCLEDLGSSLNRIKIETLVLIQVHQRDVYNDLYRLNKEKKLSDANDFEWLKQVRFSWQNQSVDKLGQGACVISICDVDYKYSFEYLGCKERLVITPLTDRCFITLSQAMGMCLGGAPSGPAGTGKTETVKDLGRAVGVFVVVTNCTDQQRFTDMARIFKGLCQAGLWGCFDEFNRIELPVLSVVAQQILAITNAKRSLSKSFTFPGDSQEISLNRNVGYFITMNPGYQGRQELPENLKVLFRGVAMMVPDREIIIKVKLCSVGYQNFADLARKFNVLYALCEQQLSKQKHYDFGLRNILSVLRTAGQTKRSRANDPEDELMLKTLRDMNLSKLVAQDVPLFKSLLSDLFPSLAVTSSGQQHSELQQALKQVITAENLNWHQSWITKVIQLYETTLVRHGIMMVGPPGSGKSKIITCLQEALTQSTGIAHKRTRLNPKAIRAKEMFGETDKLSGEWVDGIFASIWAKYNDRSRKDIHWIICDGPVDALWIENLNTVLDDNKILTLANGDRIPMTENVKLMFEVEDLRNASPATVSRAGIIYVSSSDLDWEAVLHAWLRRKPQTISETLTALFKKYVGVCESGGKSIGHLFTFLSKNCTSVMSTSRVGSIEGCCRLLDGILDACDLSNNSSLTDSIIVAIEKIFLYCLSWSVGGILEEESRLKLTQYLMSVYGKKASEVFPSIVTGSTDSIFEYYVNPDTLNWQKWKAPNWEYPSQIDDPDFSSLLVPTVESTRAGFLFQHLCKQGHSVLLTGGGGTAKTSTALMFFDQLLSSSNGSMRLKKICFSSATTPSIFQTSFETELDKRGGKSFGPPSGKKLTLFLDDLSMPEVNEWGDQPTLEIVRQLIETSGFYFLDKDKRGDFKMIEDIRYVGAMNHPSGGRQDIPNRLKRHFFIFSTTIPSVRSINDIYGQMIRGRYSWSSNYFLSIANSLPNTTVRLWSWMRQKMLPSPSKFHYTFNLHCISRVFQGVLRTPKSSLSEPKLLLMLWRHECERVFSDKLINIEDKSMFMTELNRCTDEIIAATNPSAGLPTTPEPKREFLTHQSSSNRLSIATPNTGTSNRSGHKKMSMVQTPSGQDTSQFEQCIRSDDVKGEEMYFVDFLQDDEYDEDGVLVQEAPRLYECGGTIHALRPRVQMFLDRYNESNPSRQMNIVLFDDAMRHLVRITRVLGMPKGCLLLVGVGGSGKQSLTRLASYCVDSQLFQITISKSYNLSSLYDDLRVLYKACGQRGLKTTFLFTEAEIKDETFLEVINSILTTGEVSNLIPKDELIILASELRPIALKSIPNFVDTSDNLVKFFIDRVRSNLHIVMCMSPISAKFPERARKFPGIIGGCTIDWHLPWPKEALIAVSRGYLSKLPMGEVKEKLIVHMGMVHKYIVDACVEYYLKMRRRVYQTPKSFLQFLNDYIVMYNQKCAEVDQKASRVEIGLEKLALGAQDVEKMKVLLVQEEVKLKKSEIAANVMLSKLETSSMEAKKEADSVSKIKEACQADAERIAGEKADAEEDLAKAQPFVDEAERAVGSIKPNDLNELKKLGKPSDIIKLIFDCVSILKMAPLSKVEPMEITLGVGKERRVISFIRDSYKIVQSGMLSDTRFLSTIMQFSKVEKDFINEETIEFLSPYLALDGFNPSVAKNASKAAEGLCTWTRAMADYHEASKIVKPKLEALRLAEARLQDAERELYRAESRLKGCQDVLEGLQRDFDKQLSSKRAIEENAANTRKRMEQATSLIQGLAGERARWSDDKDEFANIKSRLVGNVALACAFIAYCGPFNQEFREYILRDILSNDLKTRQIPFSATLDLTEFLADVGTIGDWNMENLPTDPLSIQNGILVTRSSRFPLLIDPQGQALNWIVAHEESRLPPFGVTSFNNPRFREQLEYCLAEGKTMIINGVEEELDPMLTPLLERQIVTKAKNRYVSVGGRMCDYNDKFFLYLITRLANPVYSPEDQSKCTIVDFTVTQRGLEEQLLGRVIQKEQRSLEESLKNVLEEVMNNTKSLLRLDQQLLERLSENSGNLLDDEELISVLADTKAKAIDVRDKLVAAADMKKNINEKREQYRPIATRGSVLFFSIVDMGLVNSMYQTSLDQFQLIFDRAMDGAEKANLSSKRIINIIDSVTYQIFRYITRGLYEKDKTSFTLIIAFKMLLISNKLTSKDVSFFLKAGSGFDNASIKAKPYSWMNQSTWLNLNRLNSEIDAFQTIIEDLANNELTFLPWFNESEPERFPVPVIEPRWVGGDEFIVNFNRLLAVRCLREDRTILAVNDFIRTLEFIETGSTVNAGHSLNVMASASGKIPALGPKYTEPITDTVESIYREMDSVTPVIYLLSAGADPTDGIEVLARRKRKDIECVSMGEGQDVVALRAINTATSNGSWVLLQNCHLGLDFIDSLEDIILKLRQPENNCSSDFRLFITTEPHPKFSIGLLQMSIKVTNEPPKGLRAGLQRSFTVVVDQDRLERIESSTWRTLLFTVCFLHSVVQERRKFGPLGWCVPYEFNQGDLNATIMFLEKHIEFSTTMSWSTIQYMASEVQYGGRITDSMDRRLFTAYTETWISPTTLQPGFTFNPDHPISKIPDNFKYKIPDFVELDEYQSYIQKVPNIDSPEILGMHPNADLTFRFKEVNQLLDTILSTQPKQVTASVGGKSRDEVVYSKCQELVASLPTEYIEEEYEERIGALGGLDVPLNIFLFQEVQRLQSVILKVKYTLDIAIQAIRGDVVVTSEIMESIDAIYDARVPKSWLFSAAGDEISWLAVNLGAWYTGLTQRDSQYRQWLVSGRPLTYWIGGFFNPQGFLTAVQQEITRAKKSESWALDMMTLHTEVTDITNIDHVRSSPREGVYVHGLMMDGAGWNVSEGIIIESAPSRLFCPFPVILVSAHYKASKRIPAVGSEYDCPVYKYPARTDKYKIFHINLLTKEAKALKWTLRGVALLCQTS